MAPILGCIIPLDPDETPDRSVAELVRSGPAEARLLVEFQEEPRQLSGSALDIDVGFVSGLGSDAQLEALAVRLVEQGAAVVAYHCTSCSFILGKDFAEELVARLMTAAGTPATATSTALIAGLRHLGAKRVTLASPYTKSINDRLIRFLGEYGFATTHSEWLGLKTGHATNPVNGIVEAALTAGSHPSDALFIACTGQKVASKIEDLEKELGLPVISANQVTLWHSAQLVGLKATGPGTLYGTVTAPAGDQLSTDSPLQR